MLAVAYVEEYSRGAAWFGVSLVEHLGRATPEELEQVDNAIRAVFEV